MGSSHCGPAPVGGCLPLQRGAVWISFLLLPLRNTGQGVVCIYIFIFLFILGNLNKLFEKKTNRYTQLAVFLVSILLSASCILNSSALASSCFLCSTSFPGRTELNSLHVPLRLSLLQPGLTGGRAEMAKGGGTCRCWVAGRRERAPLRGGCGVCGSPSRPAVSEAV